MKSPRQREKDHSQAPMITPRGASGPDRDEAGELLGISRASAYGLVARGELPVIRLGRRIVVPKAASRVP